MEKIRECICWLEQKFPAFVPRQLLAALVLDKGAYYKVLGADGSYNGFRWSLPEGETPGEWHKIAGIDFFYLTNRPRRWWWTDPSQDVFLAQWRGLCVKGADDVLLVEEARLIRKLSPVELRALGCFER
jgi:hypothetical protein